MNRMTRFFGITVVVLLILSTGMVCLAGNARQRAIAAVAIARAALEIADERPRLSDSNRTSSPPATIDSPSADPHAQECSSTSVAFQPLRMEYPKIAIVREVLPAQIVISAWERGCPACTRLEHEVKTLLVPFGWKIGNQPTDQIQFVQISQTEPVPQIVLYQNGVELKRWDRYEDPRMLSRELRAAWDEAGNNQAIRAKPFSAMPILYARAQIRTAISFFRDHIGDGEKAFFEWDRSGDRSLPLMAKEEWSTIAIFGAVGKIHLSAPNAIKMPVKDAAFGYTIEGADFIVDADPIRLPGLADKIAPAQVAGATASVQPVGIVVVDDLIFVYSAISAIKGLFELFQPSLDVMLPSQISANGTLQGDTLVVEFTKPASARFVELFTFNLTIRRLSITETNVHLDLEGSWWIPRWVKSLDLKVQ